MRETIIACLIAVATATLAAQPAPIRGEGGADRRSDPVAQARRARRRSRPTADWVAYTVRETNWDDNAYETEIWLADATSTATRPRQLTNAKKSSQSPAWSPDGSRLAFASDRTDKRQIYLINPLGGEAEALTSVEDGVTSFAWSPDGRTHRLHGDRSRSRRAIKDREKKYGEFEVVDQDYRMTHLFVVDVATRATRTLTSGAFTVGSFQWSPDGKRIAFDHRVNGSPASGGSADISIVTVADASVRALVTQEGPDSQPGLVARRHAHRLRDGDGEPGLLLHQRADRDRAGERRRADGR